MTSLSRRAACGGFLLFAGCASRRDPAPGVLRVGAGLEVALARRWSDFTPSNARKMRLLSVDGLTLNRLYLAGGLAPGEGLTARPRTGARPVHAGMSHESLVAFVADSIDTLGYAKPDIVGVRPARFGGADGVRVDLSTQTGDGLAFAATALSAERAGKLHLILYLAAREHYYAALLPDVEAIMASAVVR